MHYFANSIIDQVVGSTRIIISLLLVLSSVIAVVVRNLRERKGQSWPIVGGIVESAEMGSFNDQPRAEVTYSYSVNGEYYSGYFERTFLRESSADRFVAAIKGQAIFLRTHPNRPERSASLAQDQPGGWPA